MDRGWTKYGSRVDQVWIEGGPSMDRGWTERGVFSTVALSTVSTTQHFGLDAYSNIPATFELKIKALSNSTSQERTMHCAQKEQYLDFSSSFSVMIGTKYKETADSSGLTNQKHSPALNFPPNYHNKH